MSEPGTPSRPDSVAAAASPGTIAAIATPVGRGALALVRVSGPRAAAIGAACVHPWPVPPRTATLVRIAENRRDTGGADGRDADRALAIWFPGPGSYTGEDVLEVSTHGGALAPMAVLRAFIRAGARPAEPGEFTRRALLNGKLDLLQAEAVADVIDAAGGLLHRTALAQLSGALTSRIAALRDALIELEASLAYDIDFPDEDDGPIASGRITALAERVLDEMDRLLATLPVAQLARTGATVVLAGAPNAGKSSLFNALLGESRAIVTEHPGTTRDAIDVLIEGDPYPWRLVDTAGLREARDPVERLGVEVSARWLARADVVLLCGPTADARREAEAAIAGRSAATVVHVHTMEDLSPPTDGACGVSAISGRGLDELRRRVDAALLERHPVPPPDVPVVVRERHAAALSTARGEVRSFLDAWTAGALPPTVAATHVRAAVHALDALIGAVGTEDVLGRVFSRFCVGK